MNMKFKQVLIGAVVTLVMFSSVTAYAWPASCHDHEKDSKRAGKKMGKLIKELGLTPEQEEQIENLKSGQREAKKQLMSEIKSKKAELREELEKATIDRTKINSIVKELGTLTEDKLEQRVKNILSMRETLTPEQYEKFREKRKHFKGKERNSRSNKKKMHHKKEF